MSRRSRRHQFNPPVSAATRAISVTPTTFWQRLILGLFYFLVLTVPFFFTWINEELFEFNKMMLTYGLTVLIGGSWLMRMAFERRLIFQRTWFDLPIILFVLSQLLSTLFSIHPSTSLFGYYTRFHGGLLSVITYAVLYYAFVSNVEKKQLPTFLLVLLGAALGVTLYAIPEHYGMSTSCDLISGDWSVSCWIQDVQNRVFATFGQPNWLAAYTITLIPVGISLSVSESKLTWRQFFFIVTTLLLFITLLFTKSRSGLLGLGVAMAVYLAVLINLRAQESIFNFRAAVVGSLLAGFGVLALVFGTPWTPSLTELTAHSQPQPVVAEPGAVTNRLDVGGTESGEIRKIVWAGAVKVWQRYPVLGSGVETFAYSYYQDRPLEHNLVSEWDFLYNKAHNEFLNYLATTGLVGVVTYSLLVGAFIVYPLVRLFRLNHSPEQTATQLLYLGLATGLIGLTISNALGFSTVMVTILLFLYPAIITVIQKDKTASVPASTSAMGSADHDQTLPVIVSLVVGLVALYCLASLLTFWRADRFYAAGKQYAQAGQLAEGIAYLTKSISLAPREALYYDELSTTYAQAAVILAEQGDATQSAQIAQAALQSSNQALALNPRHVSFYKTRARVFITLAQLEPALLQEAWETLEAALALSPTEAKLVYNRGIVEISLGQLDQGRATLETAIAMKPNYEAARYQLAQQYEANGQREQALEQYRYILDNINPQNETVQQAIDQ